jgi:hypothetical protein
MARFWRILQSPSAWLAAAGVWFALAVLLGIGELLGWWHDLGLLGLVATLVLGALSLATAATQRQVATLAVPLEALSDDLATIRVVLERIARRLGA